jgi:hypothetical protein
VVSIYGSAAPARIMAAMAVVTEMVSFIAASVPYAPSLALRG